MLPQFFRQGEERRSLRRGLPRIIEKTAIVALTSRTHALGKSYVCITSKNLLMTIAIQKWSGHFYKCFLSQEFSSENTDD